MAQYQLPDKEEKDATQRMVVVAAVCIIGLFVLMAVVSILKLAVLTVSSLMSIVIQLLPFALIIGIGYLVWQRYGGKIQEKLEDIPKEAEEHFTQKDKEARKSPSDADVKL